MATLDPDMTTCLQSYLEITQETLLYAQRPLLNSEETNKVHVQTLCNFFVWLILLGLWGYIAGAIVGGWEAVGMIIVGVVISVAGGMEWVVEKSKAANSWYDVIM